MTDQVPPSPEIPQDRLNSKLLLAVHTGDIVSARRALEQGADVTAVDGRGRHGLQIIMTVKDYNGYHNAGRELLSLLLNRGLSVNAPGENGGTALHIAVLDESYTTCKYKIDDLLNFGADINARDNDGRTPLHIAAHRGNRNDGLKSLLLRKADINARDNAGVTPLHLAAERGDTDVIRALIAHGAWAGVADKQGRAPWDFAEQAGHEYLAQSLRAEAAKQKQAWADWERAQNADPWHLLGPDKVAHVKTEKKIGYRLTEEFNFAARTYTKIVQNLTTKAEGVTVVGFDSFDDKTHIARAHENLIRLGGTAPRESIQGQALPKPRPVHRLPPPPPK